MKLNSTFLLRITVVVILFMHSIPGIFNNGINDFGNLYLNQVGFAPVGLVLAWAIKISHIAAAICFLFEKYVKWAGIVTIIILIAGIFMVHLKDGWFVVGGGRNGVEFNVLLIVVILTIMYPNGLKKLV
ncbi:DoxX family protein [Emticicia soli]|uniref:DoxX family protein n=1 Tax=Emticicia soli TaxID=2027878 RepID=A0ABW5J679_9BACT